MKKILLSMFLVSCFIPFVAMAAQYKVGETASVSSGISILENLYMVAGNVSSSGTVKGDLVAVGGTLLINGNVSDDILTIGGNVSLLSDVGGDIRVGGGMITIQGKVVGDVIAGGGQISISGEGIGGDVIIGSGTVNITAPVGGNLKITGGQVNIDSPIKGNVEIVTDKLTLGPKTLIGGNLTYTSDEEATVETGATIQGKIDFKKSDKSTQTDFLTQEVVTRFFTFALLIKLLASLVCAFILLLVFPRYAKELVTTVYSYPLENLGRGFIAFVVLPIASIILCVTMVGLPIGILGLLSYAALLILVWIISPIIVGSVLHKLLWKLGEVQANWKTVIIGVTVYFLIGFIPFIGSILKFGIALIALGVVIKIKWNIAKNWR